MSDYITKKDLQETQTLLSKKIQDVKVEMTKEIQDVRVGMQGLTKEIQDVRLEMQGLTKEIQDVRVGMQGLISKEIFLAKRELRDEIKAVFPEDEREELLTMVRHYNQQLERDVRGQSFITLTRNEYDTLQKLANFPHRFQARAHATA